MTLLYKAGDKNNLGNFRPISALSVLSRGLENNTQQRLYSFCEKFSIITPPQCGLRKGRATELLLLKQKEIILCNIEQKLITLGLFIDFSKVFDRIN